MEPKVLCLLLAMLIATSMQNSDEQQLKTTKKIFGAMNKVPAPLIMSESLITKPRRMRSYNERATFEHEDCEKYEPDITCAQDSVFEWVARFINVCVMHKANLFRVGNWLLRDDIYCENSNISSIITSKEIPRITNSDRNEISVLLEFIEKLKIKSIRPNTEDCRMMMNCCYDKGSQMCAEEKFYHWTAMLENNCVLWVMNCYGIGHWVKQSNESCIVNPPDTIITGYIINKMMASKSQEYDNYNGNIQKQYFSESYLAPEKFPRPIPNSDHHNEPSADSPTPHLAMHHHCECNITHKNPHLEKHHHGSNMDSGSSGPTSLSDYGCKMMKQCHITKDSLFVCARDLNYGWIGEFENICVMWKANCYRVGEWLELEEKGCTGDKFLTDLDINSIIKPTYELSSHLIEAGVKLKYPDYDKKSPDCIYASNNICKEGKNICAEETHYGWTVLFQNICVMMQANCYKLGHWFEKNMKWCEAKYIPATSNDLRFILLGSYDKDIYDHARTNVDTIKQDCKRMEQCHEGEDSIFVCARDSNFGWIGEFENICVMWKANCYRVGEWVEKDTKLCDNVRIINSVTNNDIDNIAYDKSGNGPYYLNEMALKLRTSSKYEHDPSRLEQDCIKARLCKRDGKYTCAEETHYGWTVLFQDICVMLKANCYKLGRWVEKEMTLCTDKYIYDAVHDIRTIEDFKVLPIQYSFFEMYKHNGSSSKIINKIVKGDYVTKDCKPIGTCNVRQGSICAYTKEIFFWVENICVFWKANCYGKTMYLEEKSSCKNKNISRTVTLHEVNEMIKTAISRHDILLNQYKRRT